MRRFVLCMLILFIAGYSAQAASEQETQEATPTQENQETGAGHQTLLAQPKTVVSPDGLAGLSKVKITVDFLGQGHTGLTAEGLTTTLTAAVLRSGTVTVVSEKGNNTAASLYLDVFAAPLSWSKGTYIYYVRLMLW